MPRPITILGSTGSIGVNTLDVIARHPGRFSVFGLSAHSDVERMTEQCLQFQPRYAVMVNPSAASSLRDQLNQNSCQTEVISSSDALVALAAMDEADVVVGGIVGAAGLLSTLAAVRAGKTVLIANKEPLVMMGPEIIAEARAANATLLPLDSEHNAIFQCLPADAMQRDLDASGVRKILLTGSGGPFRTLDQSQFASVTPAQACAHPNWDMGRKISVDSATMMNKGLELIEACALFNTTPERVDIVVHPQSMIHSMVEYVDGSILSQMGSPDMRIPIAHALAWPDRIESGAEPLNVIALGKLEFEAPDLDKFPSLRLARQAAEAEGTLPTILNAANEVAVDAFLNGRLAFDQIPIVVESTMDTLPATSKRDLDSVVASDQQARVIAKVRIEA